jgi:hypothetical protein
MIESRSRGVLDRPVKPGDDDFLALTIPDFFTEPVIGRAFARSVGSQ